MIKTKKKISNEQEQVYDLLFGSDMDIEIDDYSDEIEISPLFEK